jgi:hypothetical protein
VDIIDEFGILPFDRLLFFLPSALVICGSFRCLEIGVPE